MRNNYIFPIVVFFALLLQTAQCERQKKGFIEIQTGTAKNISFNSATIEGKIVDVGPGIVNYGHCWSETNTPTYWLITNTNFGTRENTGQFTSNLDSLDAGKKYYIRAYAIDVYNESFYGDVLEVTTLSPTSPQISTSSVTSITKTTATLGGEVISDGGETVTDRGVYWGTESDSKTNGVKLSIGRGLGSYSEEVTGLSPGTTYYVTAFAANSIGTGYGDEVTFTTDPVGLPEVTTSIVTGITKYQATVGGNVTSDGGETVTDRGVYWGTESDPKTNGVKLSIGSGLGSFSKDIDVLSPGTRYYVIAYAINSNGTSFGGQVDFTTDQAELPTVTTSSVTEITYSQARVGGNVTSDGGEIVTDRGVYWGTESDPGTTGTKLSIGSGLGSFSKTITGLSPDTRYYVTAYATNINGTNFGDQVDFRTEEETVTDVDGNVYQTVRIGEQTWMKENLKTTQYRDGADIPHVTNDDDWLNRTSAAYCWYENNAATYKDLYGALYNKYVVDTEKLCPGGWHVPTDTEWKQLETFIGMDPGVIDDDGWRGTVGSKLKATSGWISGNGTDEFGFTALPGGFRAGMMGGIGFQDAGSRGYWWTYSSSGWTRWLGTSDEICRSFASPTYSWWGLSVRCVKD